MRVGNWAIHRWSGMWFVIHYFPHLGANEFNAASIRLNLVPEPRKTWRFLTMPGLRSFDRQEIQL